jgi:hypothetical protein
VQRVTCDALESGIHIGDQPLGIGYHNAFSGLLNCHRELVMMCGFAIAGVS